jgi:[ribosomal protein S18]-alanine N-acetyltransferase
MCAAPTRRSFGRTRLPVHAEPIPVRPCREQDLAQLEEIIKSAPEAAGWSGNSLRESFGAYAPYFLVAFQETEIDGFICGRQVADQAEILNLAVRPDRRRHGVGHALVQAFLQVVAQQAGTTVHLEVRESNLAAISLYTYAGFRVTGKRTGYYQAPLEAAVLMTCHVLPVTSGNHRTA